MSKATEKYQKNQELLKGWLTSHPEQKEFVSVLQGAGKAFIDCKTAEKSGINIERIEKSEILISVGQTVNEQNFVSYLQSHVKNPRVLFTSFDGVPQCIISSVGYTVTTFTLANVKNIRIAAKNNDTSAFDKYIIKCHSNNLDYEILVTIWK